MCYSLLHLIQACLGTVFGCIELRLLGADHLVEDSQQFQVAGRSDVVVAIQLCQVTLRALSDSGVEVLAHHHLEYTIKHTQILLHVKLKMFHTEVALFDWMFLLFSLSYASRFNHHAERLSKVYLI